MAGKSPIEWTEHTWNPVVGCSIVSPGCTNCYAMHMAARIEAMSAELQRQGKRGGAHYAGTTKSVKGTPVWTGKLALAPESVLDAPLQRRKPTIYFVNSMGDLFHEDADEEWIFRVFERMAVARHHRFQILTKRAERMRAILSDPEFQNCLKSTLRVIDDPDNPFQWPLPNVWLGVSAERQQEFNERWPHLRDTPAAIRFISYEPALGRLDACEVLGIWQRQLQDNVGSRRRFEWERFPVAVRPDWFICGGESGPNARPMHPDWARSLRDQCAAAGVPFFFKQFGEWAPHRPVAGGDLGGDVRAGRVRIVHPSGRSDVEVSQATGGRNTEPGSRYMLRVGKKAAGRVLDGKEHSEFPESAPAAVQSRPPGITSGLEVDRKLLAAGVVPSSRGRS
jgi:protein gp37